MSEDKVRGVPLTGPFFYGTFDQRCAIERWEDAGWTFLHWTEIPRIMAVLEGPLDEVVFIDEHGWAWKGPVYSRTNPEPWEEYPPMKSDELIVT
jgi:hypothetical protein